MLAMAQVKIGQINMTGMKGQARLTHLWFNMVNNMHNSVQFTCNCLHRITELCNDHSNNWPDNDKYRKYNDSSWKSLSLTFWSDSLSKYSYDAIKWRHCVTIRIIVTILLWINYQRTLNMVVHKTDEIRFQFIMLFDTDVHRAFLGKSPSSTNSKSKIIHFSTAIVTCVSTSANLDAVYEHGTVITA